VTICSIVASNLAGVEGSKLASKVLSKLHGSQAIVCVPEHKQNYYRMLHSMILFDF